MKVAIAAGGRFHAMHLAQQLAKRQSLEMLITFSYSKHDEQNIPRHLVQQSKRCKFLDQAFLKLRLGRLITSSSFNVVKDNIFDRFVGKCVQSMPPVDIFVGWAHYVFNSLPIIKKRSKTIIIESGSCHILEQQKLLQDEYKKFQLPYPPIHQKNYEKMLREYDAADYIIVPSSFAFRSFVSQGVAAEKLLLVPCGVDVAYFNRSLPIQVPQKFTVIFVGLLSIRKGVQYLLQAWKNVALPQSETELILVGALQKDLAAVMSKMPQMCNVRVYGSCDRATLRELYYRSSLLVLPSIEDGFGMVLGEAMAAGLPVVTTAHSAGQDIIVDGVHGFVVQSASTDALAEKIAWCYHHQEAAQNMGIQGNEHIQSYTWDKYGERVYATYQNIMEAS